ncbi:MAG: zinc-binding dehydrogenase, partial [Pseudomonadota bacterium]
LDALAPLGMMVTYGNASGPAPPIEPLELSRRGSLSLIRPSLFHYATPDRLPAMAAALFDVIANGAVTPSTPASFPLKDGADAHRLLESGDSAGSIILTP